MCVHAHNHLIESVLLSTFRPLGIEQMLFYCLATVYDVGPALKQHRLIASCLLGAVLRMAKFMIIRGSLGVLIRGSRQTLLSISRMRVSIVQFLIG